MEEVNVVIKKIDSFNELKSKVNQEQLIVFDDMQNTFLIILLNEIQEIGMAYYDYGVAPEFQYSKNRNLIYLGVGRNFLSIKVNKKEKVFNKEEIVFNDNLMSVFYEILYDSNKNYICVICELDVYCYCEEKRKWMMGFKDIIIDYKIVDDIKLLIVCDNGFEYLFSLEDGKVIG